VPGQRPKAGLIYCAVLEDEFRRVLSAQGAVVPVTQMPQGLHDDPPKLRLELQKAVSQMEDDHRPEHILLGYGLCSRGIEGVVCRESRLVVPRAHDCITLLLGSRKRYSEQIQLQPATYWHSVGWNRHHLPPGPERVKKLLDSYTELYGEDNAEFLMEAEQHWIKSYSRSVFVDTGVGPVEEEAKKTEEAAQWLGWSYDRQEGSLKLLEMMVAGDFDPAEFLILEPGQSVRMTADEGVIQAVD
jgi:hypothetical protein